jgi:hypothetical protein
MEGITDAYLAWFSSLGDAGLANDNPATSSCALQEYYPVEVLDVYGKVNLLPTFLLIKFLILILSLL